MIYAPTPVATRVITACLPCILSTSSGCGHTGVERYPVGAVTEMAAARDDYDRHCDRRAELAARPADTDAQRYLLARALEDLDTAYWADRTGAGR